MISLVSKKMKSVLEMDICLLILYSLVLGFSLGILVFIGLSKDDISFENISFLEILMLVFCLSSFYAIRKTLPRILLNIKNMGVI